MVLVPGTDEFKQWARERRALHSSFFAERDQLLAKVEETCAGKFTEEVARLADNLRDYYQRMLYSGDEQLDEFIDPAQQILAIAKVTNDRRFIEEARQLMKNAYAKFDAPTLCGQEKSAEETRQYLEEVLQRYEQDTDKAIAHCRQHSKTERHLSDAKKWQQTMAEDMANQDAFLQQHMGDLGEQKAEFDAEVDKLTMQHMAEGYGLAAEKTFKEKLDKARKTAKQRESEL